MLNPVQFPNQPQATASTLSQPSLGGKVPAPPTPQFASQPQQTAARTLSSPSLGGQLPRV